MKLFNLIVAMLVVVSASFGQAADLLKTADKSIKKYYLDPSANADKLEAAKTAITNAFADGSLADNAAANLVKGKILNEVANAEFKKKLADPNYMIKDPKAAVMAVQAFQIAHKSAEKKAGKREAMTGLVEAENHLNNLGIFAYQSEDFTNAYENFNASISAAEFLKANGGKTRLDSDSLMNEQVYFTAVTAQQSGNAAAAKPLLEKLANNGTKELFVYSTLFDTYLAGGDEDKAMKFLDMGKAIDPSNTQLLFSEINYYLKKGELNVLTEKLKKAIEQEPDNTTVYVTTGNVYDQLATKAKKDGDAAKEVEYRTEALSYFNQALEKDPNNVDATYSIGQVYYNQAAGYVDEINALSADYSPAGMKKYDAKKAEMDDLFKQALPYFQKAEKLNGNDINTIIALKEIYAKLNQLDKSAEYKAKYEALKK